MRDRYGREITYLRISVTEGCNLRCRYCVPEEAGYNGSTAAMLTEEEIVMAVESAAAMGVKKIRITGGEPLTRNNILSICRKTADVAGIETVCLTTNGLLLPKYAEGLKCAGVSRINLSLDTLQEKKYEYMTRNGNLAQVLKGLEAALKTGFEKVKINVVLIGGFNDDEIIPLAELTRQYPVDVRFIELMPMGIQGVFGADAFVSCSRVTELLPEAVRCSYDGGAARLYRLPGGLGQVGLISPLSNHFCAACNRLRLTADGTLKPCLHTASEFSIRGLTKEEMMAQFVAAIQEKPQCHGELSPWAPSQAGRTMNRIGG